MGLALSLIIVYSDTLNPFTARQELPNDSNSELSGNLRGLKPFQKGQSGNPGGKPKNHNFGKELREWLAETDPKKNKTRLQICLENVLRFKPDVLLHYAFGKPAETLTLQNPDGSAFRQTLVIALSQAITSGQVVIPNQVQDASKPIVDVTGAIVEEVKQ